jgi:hypothetical protein
MPVRPAVRLPSGRPLDGATPQFTSLCRLFSACDCGGAYPSRAKRVTGKAPPFVPRFPVAPCQAVNSVNSDYAIGSLIIQGT